MYYIHVRIDHDGRSPLHRIDIGLYLICVNPPPIRLHITCTRINIAYTEEKTITKCGHLMYHTLRQIIRSVLTNMQTRCVYVQRITTRSIINVFVNPTRMGLRNTQKTPYYYHYMDLHFLYLPSQDNRGAIVKCGTQENGIKAPSYDGIPCFNQQTTLP